MYRIQLQVGRTTISLFSKRRFPALIPDESMGRFVVDKKNTAGIHIVVREEPLPVPGPKDLLFDSGSLWKVFRTNKSILYTFRNPDGRDDFGRGLALQPGSGKAELFLPPSHLNEIEGYALSYPLGELLFQHHAARTGAMVIHACGVTSWNRAILFCGKSGSGKTTLANLWHSHRPLDSILSDDRVLVQWMNWRPYAFGTPWHGEGRYCAAEGHPIAAVFFIRHGGEVSVDPLLKSMAAAELMSHSFYPPWDAGAIQATIQTSSRICEKVLCSRLAFTPDPSVMEAVETFLESGFQPR